MGHTRYVELVDGVDTNKSSKQMEVFCRWEVIEVNWGICYIAMEHGAHSSMINST